MLEIRYLQDLTKLLEQENSTIFFSALDKFTLFLEETREKFNLLGKNEIIADHILDSLAALPYFLELLKSLNQKVAKDSQMGLQGLRKLHIADLGSGAGFPALVLALALETLNIGNNWYLIERTQKKADFLEASKSKLEAFLTKNILTIIPKNLREWRPPKLDLVISRAFRPLDTIIHTLKHLAPRAEFLFYKGRRDQIDEEFLAWTKEPHKIIEIQTIMRLNHFVEKERHLVHFCWI